MQICYFYFTEALLALYYIGNKYKTKEKSNFFGIILKQQQSFDHLINWYYIRSKEKKGTEACKLTFSKGYIDREILSESQLKKGLA